MYLPFLPQELKKYKIKPTIMIKKKTTSFCSPHNQAADISIVPGFGDLHELVPLDKEKLGSRRTNAALRASKENPEPRPDGPIPWEAAP